MFWFFDLEAYGNLVPRPGIEPVPPAAAAAKSLQSCPTLCDPIDGSPPGSPFPGILQARALEWVAINPSPMHESETWKWSRSVMSNPQRPHGLQPTRLLRPWDFPGKNTGVGCLCLLRIPPAMEGKVLTTGTPGRSPCDFFKLDPFLVKKKKKK